MAAAMILVLAPLLIDQAAALGSRTAPKAWPVLDGAPSLVQLSLETEAESGPKKEDTAEDIAERAARHRASALQGLQALCDLSKKRLTGSKQVSWRQQLRQNIKEVEGMAPDATAELDRARITLVESISAGARSTLEKALETKTLPELQSAIAEASTKSAEIEKVWAAVKDPNSTSVGQTRFQVKELDDAKSILADEMKKESKKVAARLRLMTVKDGHNPNKTQAAILAAEEAGLTAFEIQEARVAMANQQDEARAVDGIKAAFKSNNFDAIEASISKGETANVPAIKLNGYRKKLIQLKQKSLPQQPKAEKPKKSSGRHKH